MVFVIAWPLCPAGESSLTDGARDASAFQPDFTVTCGLSHLKDRRDFVRAARGGRSWATPGLVLQIRRRSALRDECCDMIRVGVTASRKVGGAVVRNRIRRRLRAAAKEVLSRHSRPGYDYVLIGRATTAHRPYESLVADLKQALKRMKVYREETKHEHNRELRGTAQ